MVRSSVAARSPRTWVLAACFVAALDALVTRTPLLWAPTSFERGVELRGLVLGQAFDAARTLYWTPRPPGPLVTVVGNSRIWMPARPAVLEPLVARQVAGAHVRNLAVFGAGVGDSEMVSRHLHRLAPDVVVVALGTSDLVDTAATPLAGVAARLLATGFADGPLPARGPAERLDRWMRTLWPLYRFRDFARAALADRVSGRPVGTPFPAAFATTRDFFATVHGARADAIEAAYRAWRAERTLAAFVRYLEVGSPAHLALVMRRTRELEPPAPDGPGARMLAALLDRTAGLGARAVVVLMPEPPVLATDTTGTYRRPGFSDAAAAVVRAVAARRGVAVVDARAWMPDAAFLDFDHLWPGLSDFPERLAPEIARVGGV